MGLQVALEVEDLELIGLRERQQLAQRRIGLDDLLHHQRMLLRVPADTRRDLRAGEERTLGDSQERAERIRDRRRLREDRLLLGSGNLTLSELDCAAAAALGGALELARHLLLELLHISEEGAERGAERVDLLHNGIDLRDDIDLLNDRRGRGSLNVGERRNGRCRGRRRRGNRGRNDNGRGRGGRGGRGRRGLLGSTLGGRGGGRHLSYVGGRGSFTGIQTREYILPHNFYDSQFCPPGG